MVVASEGGFGGAASSGAEGALFAVAEGALFVVMVMCIPPPVPLPAAVTDGMGR